MSTTRSQKVAYVLKRYPRFSETFVVNEILAHERAGLEVAIFALRPTSDTHFQHGIADVRAPVTHLRYGGIRADLLWSTLAELATIRPQVWEALRNAGACDGVEVYQAAVLAQELVRREIDHVHAHFATTATTVARLAAAFAVIPYSFTAHAKDIFHEYVDPDSLEQKLMDAATVVTVSDFNVGFLRKNYSVAADKVRRVYNGLNLDDFNFTPPHARGADIVAVGRLVEKKGFADLVHACALLAQAKTDFRCRIIGGGELADQLHELVARLHLQSRVQLVGPQPLAEVRRSIQNAALLVAPCVTASTGDQDGLPTVLLEAMALGTPCVATDVTGISEAIRHEETGLLVPQQQPVELARAIERLIADHELQGQLAGAARALVEQQFNIDTNTAELRDRFLAASCGSQRVPMLAEVG